MSINAFVCLVSVLLVHFVVAETSRKITEDKVEEDKEIKKDRNDSDAKKKPPHIIYIMAPDLGWNDVSFHGSADIPTPNIDTLASSGIVLQNYYTSPYSSPSRAAVLTGLYPIHIGFQGGDIKNGEPSCLPNGTKIVPEYLKDLGYATHLIGKWHLGYSTKECMPRNHGFDSFFGCLNGNIDHYDYTSFRNYGDVKMWGVDFYEGDKPQTDFRGEYMNEVLTDRATEIITVHDITKPLFLLFSATSPQAGNIYAPLQAPPQDVRQFKHIQDIKRRTYAGAVWSLDKTVGAIFQALKDRNMTSNSVIVFASVNGAAVAGYDGGWGSNWPLRGQKWNLFEGGVRVPAFIWSPLFDLDAPMTSLEQLVHATDWMPTLYYIAGGDIEVLGKIDGFNVWPQLLDNSPSLRSEILLNADGPTVALRIGDYKLIQGSFDSDTGWQSPSPTYVSLNTSLDEWVWSFDNTMKTSLANTTLWLSRAPDDWRNELVIDCSLIEESEKVDCDPGGEEACLFNIVRDPCEQVNLAQKYPKIVQVMKNRLMRYRRGIVDAVSQSAIDPRADPRCHDFVFVPWLEDDYAMDCRYGNGF